MRILLFGKYGQLGWELERTLAPLGEVIALDYPEIDLASTSGLERTIQDIRPQVLSTQLLTRGRPGRERARACAGE